MIAALTGRLAAKAPSHITLEVQGVGYEVFIPLSTFYALPDLNESTSLRIHTYLREDAKGPQVYGDSPGVPVLVGWGSTKPILLDARARLAAEGTTTAVARA